MFMPYKQSHYRQVSAYNFATMQRATTMLCEFDKKIGGSRQKHFNRDDRIPQFGLMVKTRAESARVAGREQRMASC
jgi:hypothetical protein